MQQSLWEVPEDERFAAEGAPALEEFLVVPRHQGTWEGDWFVSDASGTLLARFGGVIKSWIGDNRWINELRQFHPDGRVELQRFVGVPRDIGRLEMVSATPAMASFRMLVQEIDETRLMVELSEKETGSLRGVELVTLLSPNRRVRTMQAIQPNGAFFGTTNIIERRIENTTTDGGHVSQ